MMLFGLCPQTKPDYKDFYDIDLKWNETEGPRWHCVSGQAVACFPS